MKPTKAGEGQGSAPLAQPLTVCPTTLRPHSRQRHSQAVEITNPLPTAARATFPSNHTHPALTGSGPKIGVRPLRDAQTRAVDRDGRPTFPILHKTDAEGRPVAVPRGSVPSMHSFRHTVASLALLAGESVDEVAFLLGHRDGTVTRTVYVREVADARRAMRRSRMTAEYAGALRVALEPEPRGDR